MRPKDDPYYECQKKAIELEYMLNSPTTQTTQPERPIIASSLEDRKPLPDIMSFAEVLAYASDPDKALREIIEGALHEGCKLQISGSSKAGKTWTLVNLAVAASQGKTWLGFPVKKSRVLYLDFELKTRMATERFEAVAENMGMAPGESNPNLDYWSLRGHRVGLDDLLDVLTLRASRYDLLIIDPFYKLEPPQGTHYDENDAGSISDMMNMLESFASETGAAIVFAHHYSKGNKSEVDALDRSSGSGVFSRDPDTVITLTAHSEEGCLLLETKYRNHTYSPPKVLEFSSDTFPVFKIRDDLEPTLRKAGQASESKQINERLADTLIRELKLQTRKIESRNQLIELLQKVTNIDIGRKKINAIIEACGDRIVQEKQGNGSGILYSANFELEAE